MCGPRWPTPAFRRSAEPDPQLPFELGQYERRLSFIEVQRSLAHPLRAALELARADDAGTNKCFFVGWNCTV
jgi:hypothetical protein